LNAIDVPDNDKIFSLASITTSGDLDAAREIDLEKFTDDQLFPSTDSDDEGESFLMRTCFTLSPANDVDALIICASLTFFTRSCYRESHKTKRR